MVFGPLQNLSVPPPNKSLQPTRLTALRAVRGTRAVRAAAELRRYEKNLGKENGCIYKLVGNEKQRGG